ncbi:DUF983 domain-containing protein [Algimonas porphyrae]|uniref:DUF983 domain-containing protein n=1 Tax=Algimonas porphyrae TaxID=1128113 RepID=A0ABQ5UXU2_9PROT|nr:DUF983 domain-containing protein [Algimonas porphyrae]GLQ19191.1 hypothetical protein GCM10007854_01460 [Algimonas porphyrae]
MNRRYHGRSPVETGIRLRCGNCGRGKLFYRYLKFKDECDVCGQSFAVADTADGPAFFVGFLALIIFTPAFVIAGLVPETRLGFVITMIVMTIIGLGSILLLLPVFKAVLFNLQIHHRAEEGKFTSFGEHGVVPENWKRKDQTNEPPTKKGQAKKDLAKPDHHPSGD